MSERKRLLWVGDAACPSGFATATHGILETLRQTYDVTVLGINYNGDPYDYPYDIYAASGMGDSFGVGRLIWMCDRFKPDVIVLQNDGWNIPFYVAKLKRRDAAGQYEFPEHASIPIVACVAVDGKNFNGEWLKGIALAIFWTQFALNEAREGGYTGPAVVIPLGVDLETFKSLDKAETRAKSSINVIGEKVFIVGNVNRNQPRKRWDLTVKCFADWITKHNVNDAWLYLHSAPTGDMSIDVMALARYYNVLDRTVLVQPPPFYGISDEEMCMTYNCFDVLLSTTQGEGMGLPAMEAMACEVPCLLPDWAAYGDWARDAAMLVPCSSTNIGFPYKNVLGGVVNEEALVSALDSLYRDHALRMHVASKGAQRVREDRFRWATIGARYAEVIAPLLAHEATEEEWTDLGRPAEPIPSTHAELLENKLAILRGETQL
jgi:D-inositol-3-phosphate glycosyltransferase